MLPPPSSKVSTMPQNATDQFDFNFTSDYIPVMAQDPSGRSFLERVLGVFVTLLVALTSFLGNLAVVLVYLWNESLHAQTGNVLVAYSSVIDMLTAAMVMLPSAIAVASDGWTMGQPMCKAHAHFTFCFGCSSCFNLALIRFDRFIAVVYPLRYTSWMTSKVMAMICVFIFVQSTAVGLMMSMPDWVTFDYGEGMCTIQYTNSSGVLNVVFGAASICFFPPVAMMGVCNFMIIRTARRSGRRDAILFVRRTDGPTRPQVQQKDSDMRKTINSLLVVILMYFLSFFPSALTKITKTMLSLDAPQWWNLLTTIFMFLGSATNPFIYAILRKDYSIAFKKLPKMLKEMLFRR